MLKLCFLKSGPPGQDEQSLEAREDKEMGSPKPLEGRQPC